MHKIVLATPGKRFGAAVIDFIFFLLLLLGLFAASQAIFSSFPYVGELSQEIETESLRSGLYKVDSEGNVVPDVTGEEDQVYGDYTHYEEKLIYYYTVYLPSIDFEQYGGYDHYWYNVHILGLEDTRKEYGEYTLTAPSDQGDDYFEYQTSSDGQTLVDEIAVPKEMYYSGGDRENGLTEAGRSALRNFFYDPSGSNPSLFYNAVEHLSNTPALYNLMTTYGAFQRAYPLAAAIAIAYPLYYLVIPLFFKNGETLAKKMFGLCLLSKIDFQIHKGQLVLRVLPFYFLAIIFILFLPEALAYLLLLAVLFISYMCALFSSDRKAIHDYVAGTKVIDAKKSLFYHDRAEQEEGEAIFKESIKRGSQIKEKGETIVEDEEKKKLGI